MNPDPFSHKIEQIEKIVLVMFIITALFLGAGKILGNTIVHDSPQGYVAKDAYWHEAYQEYIVDTGRYVETPPFMVEGKVGVAPIQPPLYYYFIASFAALTSLRVYDVNQIMLSFILILCSLLVYMIIRRANVKLALVSLPLTLLVYTYPFAAGITWGQHLFIMGMFFLFLGCYFLTSQLRWFEVAGLALGVGGMIYTHTAEFLYFIPVLGLVGIVKIIARKWNEIVRIAIACGVGIVLAIDYLVIFSQTWLAEGGDPIRLNHIIETGNFGAVTVHYTHFGWLWWLIFAGLLLSIYTLVKKKEHGETNAVFIALFLVSLGTYLNQWRIYQFRFLWPLMLAFFFGLFLYVIIQEITKRKSEDAQSWSFAGTSVIVGIVIIGTMLITVGPVSLIQPSYWQSITNLGEQISPEDEVLFVDPSSQWEKGLWQLKTVTPHQVLRKVPLERIAARNFSDVYPITPICEGTNYYRESFFSFTAATDVVKACDIQERSICSYDYIVFNFQNYGFEHTAYWEEFFRSVPVKIIHNNNAVIIIKILQPQESCTYES